MVTPGGRSTSMVIEAMAILVQPEASDSVLSVEQHFPSKVTGGSRAGKPQKARSLLLTPEEPLPFIDVNCLVGLAALFVRHEDAGLELQVKVGVWQVCVDHPITIPNLTAAD